MKILLLEPYYGGSHRQWADGLSRHSRHEVIIYTLPGSHWKWRMHGGAVSFAQRFLADDLMPDLILGTDMLDMGTFLGLTAAKCGGIPTAMYFHENQLSYPWSPTDQDVKDQRDNHYKYINYVSALASNHIFFNSEYHRNSFISALNPFLKAFPDHKNLDTIVKIEQKSSVLTLGMELKKLAEHKIEKSNDIPILLWNHRWEYDKNPDLFFNTLIELKKQGLTFKLIILGQGYKKSPPVFEHVREVLKEEIIHYGYAFSMEVYAQLLWQADILPVTSNQDFFGGSVVEAIYCGCIPLLPNRLAYPQHLNAHEKYLLYEDDATFKQMLGTIIKDYKSDKYNVSIDVSKYDWESCIGGYDYAFELVS